MVILTLFFEIFVHFATAHSSSSIDPQCAYTETRLTLQGLADTLF